MPFIHIHISIETQSDVGINRKGREYLITDLHKDGQSPSPEEVLCELEDEVEYEYESIHLYKHRGSY